LFFFYKIQFFLKYVKKINGEVFRVIINNLLNVQYLTIYKYIFTIFYRFIKGVLLTNVSHTISP